MPERLSINYKNCSEKFTKKHADYTKQYCSIYLTRLRDMEVFLIQRIQEKWGDRYPICKLHKLTEFQQQQCIVIGTLFKDQKLKPSVLKTLAEGNQLVPQPVLTHFTDDSDVMFMEDEVQRYQIIGNIPSTKLVTGITCALLGQDIGKGKFQVDEYIFAGYRPQIPRPQFSTPTYILLLSGLNFIQHEKTSPNLQLLCHWLQGSLGDERVPNICRVVIAGNSIRTEPAKSKTTISMVSRVSESQESIDAVKSFDEFLVNLCEVVDVDVMPGEYDPSNHILPQKPMHFCMFPQSSVFKSFNQVSNPYMFELGGVKITGTSGQNVKDVKRYCDISDPLEVMEMCLEWNHLAPTAPDTLKCFPYYDTDPFILEECSHVFFAGNMEEFATKIVKGDNGQEVCLISVPEFQRSFEAVLLNLQTLHCEPVCFQTK